MKPPNRLVYWSLLILLTLAVWLQICTNRKKDAYIKMLETVIDNQIEESYRLKNELHDLNIRTEKVADGLHVLDKGIVK